MFLFVEVSDELMQELDVQSYFEEKFGSQYLSGDAYVFLEEIRDCWVTEHSEDGRGARESLLRKKMIELKKQNRWKREE